MRRLDGMTVYLSGPMRDLSQETITRLFGEAERACVDAGARMVFNPARAWGTRERTREWYMRHDLHRLTESEGDAPLFDAIVLMSGWSTADGCQHEYRAARASGIEAIELREIMDYESEDR